MKKIVYCRLLSLTVLCVVFAAGSLRAQDQRGKWRSLFDGKTLSGWHAYQDKPMNSWEVVDGMIANKGNTDTTLKHADLTTIEEFENFQLNIDWKIAPKSNSGILYMVAEQFPSSYLSGPEYQLIDDKGYPGKLENWQLTGANYAMDPPLIDAANPVGEWNKTVIIVNHGKVQHWLNNKKIVEYQVGSDSWQQHKANGKWKNATSYGLYSKGHIVLQDHGGQVWFKNIDIKEL